MTFESMSMLLAALAVITGGLTEFAKRGLDALKIKYASNVLALVVAAIVGGIGTVIFYIAYGVAFTAFNIAMIFVMVVATAGCAMFGYDKVIQLIKQVKEILTNK